MSANLAKGTSIFLIPRRRQTVTKVMNGIKVTKSPNPKTLRVDAMTSMAMSKPEPFELTQRSQ